MAIAPSKEKREKAAAEAGQSVVDARREALQAAGINIKKLAHEFATIAFSDIKNYVNITEAGVIQAISLDEIKPKRASKAIKKIKEQKRTFTDENDAIIEDVKVEYELYDKMDALKYLTKLGGWEPKNQDDEDQEDAQPVQVIIQVKDARVTNGN